MKYIICHEINVYAGMILNLIKLSKNKPDKK